MRSRISIATHSRLTAALVAGGLALAGCAQGPEYERPDLGVEPPSRFVAESAEVAPAGGDPAAARLDSAVVPRAWWEAFADTTLNRLVEQALRWYLGMDKA